MNAESNAVANALPCPHCGCEEIEAETIYLDTNLKENYDEVSGRLYCLTCGASTRLFPLGAENHDEAADSRYWQAVLAAWNLRAAPCPPNANSTPEANMIGGTEP